MYIVGRATLDVWDRSSLTSASQIVLTQASAFAGVANLLERCLRFLHLITSYTNFASLLMRV